nr:hypothetical protein [Tanacetum cinerariifolium]
GRPDRRPAEQRRATGRGGTGQGSGADPHAAVQRHAELQPASGRRAEVRLHPPQRSPRQPARRRQPPLQHLHAADLPPAAECSPYP